MGWMDRLFGQNPASSKAPAASAMGSADDQALARYRYLLRTAPPEAIEQAHAEAFAQLTPAQRAQALRGLSQSVPVSERGMATDDQPQTLARMATRAELRQPGTLERTFGGGGFGGMMAGSLLGSIAGTFIGTAIAHQFLGGFDAFDNGAEGFDGEPGDLDASSTDAGLEEDNYGDAGSDFGGDDMFDV